MQFDPKPRRPDIAGGWHIDTIAGAKQQRAEHAADRLRKASARILRRRDGIGKAAAPGRAAPQRARGEAVDEIDS